MDTNQQNVSQSFQDYKTRIGHYNTLKEALAAAMLKGNFVWRIYDETREPYDLVEIYQFAQKYDKEYPITGTQFYWVSREGAIGISMGLEYRVKWLFVPMEEGLERDDLVIKMGEKMAEVEEVKGALSSQTEATPMAPPPIPSSEPIMPSEPEPAQVTPVAETPVQVQPMPPIPQPEPVVETPVMPPIPQPEPVVETPVMPPLPQPEPVVETPVQAQPIPPMPQPEPIPQPEPVLQPVQQPAPQPQFVPQPEPVPEPVQQPAPQPQFVPQPEPVPQPVQQPAPQSQQQPMQPKVQQPVAQGGSKSKLPLIIGGIAAALLIIGGGFFAYKYFAGSKDAPAQQTEVTATTTESETPTTEQAVQSADDAKALTTAAISDLKNATTAQQGIDKLNQAINKGGKESVEALYTLAQLYGRVYSDKDALANVEKLLPKDAKKAHELNEKAVELDNTYYPSLYELGCDYMAGDARGAVDRDIDKAKQYFTQGAKYAQQANDTQLAERFEIRLSSLE